ncbi:MAG: isocitrate lyase/phosphoenolpyruvate mutase family protein [Pseudomonadota bacterium]
MSVRQRAEDFRALHNDSESFLIANPWDLGSAKLLEGVGFPALATTSGGFAWSQGAVDGQVTLNQTLEHCRSLVEATTVPVSADLGYGYGESPTDVYQCVESAAATGLAGCSIEDANVTKGLLFEKDLAVERIQAAMDVVRQLDREFVFTARSDGFAYGGTDLADTLERLVAFADAGADVIYAPGVTDLGMIRELVAATDKSVNVLIGFRGMDLGFEELRDAGVKRISVGTQPAKIAYGALLQSAEELLARGRIVATDVPVRSSSIAKFFV